MTETKQTKSTCLGIFVSLLCLMIGLTGLLICVSSIFYPLLFILGSLMIMLALVLRAGYAGIISEFLSLTNFLISLVIALVVAIPLGGMLGINVFIGTMTIFYMVFLFLYILIGLIFRLIEGKGVPGFLSRLTGAFLGFCESIVVIIIVFVMLTMVPTSSISEYRPEFVNRSVQSVSDRIQPLLPSGLSTAVSFANTIQNVASLESYDHIDPEVIQKIAEPLLNVPEIQRLQENPEIIKLAEEGKIPELLAHKDVQALLSSKQLFEELNNIDWESLNEHLMQKQQ